MRRTKVPCPQPFIYTTYYTKTQPFLFNVTQTYKTLCFNVMSVLTALKENRSNQINFALHHTEAHKLNHMINGMLLIRVPSNSSLSVHQFTIHLHILSRAVSVRTIWDLEEVFQDVHDSIFYLDRIKLLKEIR